MKMTSLKLAFSSCNISQKTEPRIAIEADGRRRHSNSAQKLRMGNTKRIAEPTFEQAVVDIQTLARVVLQSSDQVILTRD